MAVKIYIDQGHNPVNPNAGAEGNGLREQDLMYRIGKVLELLLEADDRFEVRLSRPNDYTQLGTSTAGSLIARVNDANSWGADYFISLHANASTNSRASGSEGYAYSSTGAGYAIGEDILFWLNNLTGLRNRGMRVRPSLYVLRKTRMPAVLLELGFITNAEDAALMSGSPELFAEGIYRGLLDYLGY